MAEIWAQVAMVFGLALIASLIAHRYRFSTALVEIIVGMVAARGPARSAWASGCCPTCRCPWSGATATATAGSTSA
ncbi:MAG: hypothetical protein AB7P48_08295, partial [Methylocystis sp.]